MALMSSRLYRHFRKSSGARNSRGTLNYSNLYPSTLTERISSDCYSGFLLAKVLKMTLERGFGARGERTVACLRENSCWSEGAWLLKRCLGDVVMRA